MIRVYYWTERGRAYNDAMPDYKTAKTGYVFQDLNGKRFTVKYTRFITIEKLEV